MGKTMARVRDRTQATLYATLKTRRMPEHRPAGPCTVQSNAVHTETKPGPYLADLDRLHDRVNAQAAQPSSSWTREREEGNQNLKQRGAYWESS